MPLGSAVLLGGAALGGLSGSMEDHSSPDSAGRTWYDPLGLFGEGGLLGPPDTAAQDAQAAFLQRMMGREGDLYPELKQKLADAGLLSDQALQTIKSGTGEQYGSLQSALSKVVSFDNTGKPVGLAPDASAAMVGEINKLYPGAISSIQAAGQNAQNFQLAPDALAALNKIRESRLANIQTDATDLIGKAVADLNRRGMMSSSTAEGSMKGVGTALEPAINQAEADYQNALLTLPQQQYNTAKDVAATTYSMGQNQGAVNAKALEDLSKSLTDISTQKYNAATTNAKTLADAMATARGSLLDPYLEMWKASAGIGSTPPATAPTNAAGASAIGQIGGGAISAFA